MGQDFLTEAMRYEVDCACHRKYSSESFKDYFKNNGIPTDILEPHGYLLEHKDTSHYDITTLYGMIIHLFDTADATHRMRSLTEENKPTIGLKLDPAGKNTP